ncbi:MAG TPA: hypothetical protein VD838_21200 [Anaeromyxobacteraceae bacterium]|nr:hypothetical protein [Anaeromyxobacteraceae bacterium]
MSRGVRVADASAKLHPDAIVRFRVLACGPALQQAEAALGRFDYVLDVDSADSDGYYSATCRRRAGYVHVTDALRELFESGAITSARAA